MHTKSSDAGFSLVELLVATAISLVVIGTAMTTFKDAIAMNDTATNTADAGQNLRGGVNFLVRDLVATGRSIPTGGIDIPTVAGGAGPIKRPSPPGLQYYFNNTTASTIMAVTTGEGLGPTVDNQITDMVTLLMLDPILDACLNGALAINPFGTNGNVPVLAQDGGSFSVGTNVPCQEPGATGNWLAGDKTQGQAPIQKGDLILFTNPIGQALQTVTRTDATNVYFEANSNDAFGLNQRNVTAGSITQILSTPDANGQPAYQGMTAQRVFMYTYYVDSSIMGEPHLIRQLNNSTPQALAGIVEDLELSYDIVDGTVNPSHVKSLPYTLNGVTYAANQIRKVNLHIGVRSENLSTRLHDYLRNHLTTVVSLRSLAFVDRYSYDDQ
jgi:prepilin-type N-terminal cleavage/methylation domain-containing protein